MADFDLGEGLRRVFLAGVGALATGVELGQQSFEKSQQIVDGLVKKGELTVEQGKALNTELKHKAQEAKEKAEEKTEGAKEQSDAGAAAEDPSPGGRLRCLACRSSTPCRPIPRAAMPATRGMIRNGGNPHRGRTVRRKTAS